MSKFSISIRPFGVHAILVEWPNKVDEVILNDILRFSNFLETSCLDINKWEIVPAYNSITLILRQEPIQFDRLIKRLKQWYGECGDSKPKQKYLWKLPVCYDLDFGIDLEEVAEKLSLNIKEVVKQHTENVYTVFGIGFLPGFMYLGGLPKSLEIARRATPRLKVQKGAVGLAGKQTGIYPQESPGGWNIIGNCSVPMFNPKSDNPCFVSVGDKVQFFAIERAEYDLHKIEGEVGIYKLEKTKWDA
ncbi:5-oxoprolinase subunit PxpB [Maribacter algarum]|uniref:5-oxoprolinase subunit PxpB n=1 Tax=Maribacter algarum (ex Zhang et al. 2020) TaxID=2578118 RepID=A0A5S3PQY4_9FLAO|nr:5-oxoprolinase subunit PxpB [Maribacter algarum]TMM57122.1 5-oxoprolinase subunit PxpB [Maribacter algarum]